MKDEYQQRLVERIRSKDRAAETELFVRYQKPLHWKICRHIKADAEHIKDVAGEIYLAILQGLSDPKFDAERWESLDAYIWGVTKNKIRDWFKRANRERVHLNPGPPPAELTKFTEEYVFENEELKKHLRALLKRLPPKYKEVLDLKFFEELSVQEISDRIGLAPRRVSERINYALKLARKAIKKMK